MSPYLIIVGQTLVGIGKLGDAWAFGDKVNVLTRLVLQTRYQRVEVVSKGMERSPFSQKQEDFVGQNDITSKKLCRRTWCSYSKNSPTS